MAPNGKKQIEEELALIEEKHYEPFFLTVHDIVRFARGGHPVPGRGSAANSLVCYCLHITEVSPEQANLLFGRFFRASATSRPISTWISSTSGAKSSSTSTGNTGAIARRWPRR
jgi:error-prone DNA polymerase